MGSPWEKQKWPSYTFGLLYFTVNIKMMCWAIRGSSGELYALSGDVAGVRSLLFFQGKWRRYFQWWSRFCPGWISVVNVCVLRGGFYLIYLLIYSGLYSLVPIIKRSERREISQGHLVLLCTTSIIWRGYHFTGWMRVCRKKFFLLYCLCLGGALETSLDSGEVDIWNQIAV